MRFSLDEMMGWEIKACSPSDVKARRLFKKGQTYTLDECRARGMTPEEILWFIMVRARMDRETLARVRAWVRACGGNVHEHADVKACEIEYAKNTVARIVELRQRGMSREEARATVTSQDFDTLVTAFED